MIGIELIMACAPSVAPATVQQVIMVESGGNELAIGVNGGRLQRQARDAADAAELARAAIQQGYSVDLGLMQVNSKNLRRLGYSVEDMFDPCKNLAAGAKVLTEFYLSARARYSDEQAALRAALSAYNTGSYSRGFANGYVAKYDRRARPQPSIVPVVSPPPGARGEEAQSAVPADPRTITSIVFIRGQEASTMHHTETTTPVISTSDTDANTPGVHVEHTAESAERNGAFEETAIGETDAWESNTDLHDTAIMIGGKRVGGQE